LKLPNTPKKGKEAAEAAVVAGTEPFWWMPPPTPYSERIRAWRLGGTSEGVGGRAQETSAATSPIHSTQTTHLALAVEQVLEVGAKLGQLHVKLADGILEVWQVELGLERGVGADADEVHGVVQLDDGCRTGGWCACVGRQPSEPMPCTARTLLSPGLSNWSAMGFIASGSIVR
jgi:hypothetical protein